MSDPTEDLDKGQGNFKAGLDANDTRETFTDVRRDQLQIVQQKVQDVVNNYKGGL
jgi:hypothetical protein